MGMLRISIRGLLRNRGKSEIPSARSLGRGPNGQGNEHNPRSDTAHSRTTLGRIIPSHSRFL